MHGPHDFRVLTEEECRTLLGSTPVGRIVYTRDALPAIAPVNFVMDRDEIVLRTASGSKLDAATRNAIVAFEIDQIDPATQTGWSVVVVGHATHETDPAVIARMRQLPLRSWMPDEGQHYVRIRCEQVTGRLLDGRRPPPPW